MKKKVIRLRKNLQLRKIKNQYMIVEACTDNVNMCNVYSLNQTAAELWKHISEGEYTAEDLAEWLCCIYVVEFDIALHDVERQLTEWSIYGLID